jgi:hypothetical protein
MITDTIVHVGYGKTATTWLQEKIFDRLGHQVYLGKRSASFPDWLLRANYLDEFAYQEQRERLRAEITAILENRERAVISSEAFTNLGVVYQQIERIDYLIPGARVVLVLRDPVSWLISNYKYCVEHEGFWRPLESYIDFGIRRTPFALEKRAPFYVPDFFYDEVVRGYESKFGRDRLLVLRYEDFVADPGSFGRRLASFMRTDLPDFAGVAKEKILESPPSGTVEELRLANMRRHLADAGFQVDRLAPARPGEPIASAQLLASLKDTFASHCGAFYPELAR